MYSQSKNALNIAHRKELKKVTGSKASMLGADSLHTPGLWIFNTFKLPEN